ncbi:MAG: alpha/beta fold hydrolase [Spirochaetia bacterium]
MKREPYPLERYLSAQSASSPKFSSDGKKLFFKANITGTDQLFSVPVRLDSEVISWPEQHTFGKERIISYAVDKQNPDRTIYSRDSGGNENAQLFLLDERNREINLTRGHETAMHIMGQWREDGEKILFAANRRNKGLFDLYMADLNGREQLILESDEPGYLRSAKFSPDGKKIVVIKAVSSFRQMLIEIDLSGPEAQILAGKDEDIQIGGIEYSSDGSFLYCITDSESDFLNAARYNLKDRRFIPVISREWDAEMIKLSDSEKYLACSFNVDGYSELMIRDLKSGDTTVAGLPVRGIISGFDISPDESTVAFGIQGASRTEDIYCMNLNTYKSSKTTRSSHGGLPVETFLEPDIIHYESFDGRSIPAYYFLPQNREKKSPVIVIVHGGPEGQARPSFSGLIQYYLHSGFAVFIPNVRGSTGYGKAYSHLDDVEKRMDSVADLEYGAKWLKEQTEVDPEGLIIFGGSYGGFMVLSALTEYPETWAAGVDIVGISNFVTFLENTSSYRRAHREAEYGSLAENRDFLERISPIHKSDQIKVPLFVIHGANDPRVPLSEAEQLVDKLRGRNVPVRLMVFDNEGHGLSKLENKLKAYPEMIDWLQEHLKLN